MRGSLIEVIDWLDAVDDSDRFEPPCIFAEGGPDGMAEDGLGRYWVALTTAHRIALIDPRCGEVDQVVLERGSLPTNVCRDHEGAGLYVTVGLAGALLHVVP